MRQSRDPRDRRITTIVWVVFLVMWGATFALQLALQVNLVNLQYVLAGLILLGLNGARFASGMLMSRLTLTLGFMAVAAGTVRHFAGELTIISAVITAVGCVLLAHGLTMAQDSQSGRG